MQESQLFARKFAKTFNCKWGGKQFTIQIGLAKNLLKSYPYDDLDLLLDYIKEYPLLFFGVLLFRRAFGQLFITQPADKADKSRYGKQHCGKHIVFLVNQRAADGG